MTGKMAIIYCGGKTEVEMGEVRDKIVDGLNAVKSAMIHVFTIIIIIFIGSNSRWWKCLG
jgi:hypothetical protein